MREALNCNRLKKWVISFVLFSLFITPLTLFADSAPGIIEYIDGVVDVFRSGDDTEWEEADYGMELYIYDLIETGPDGYAEIRVQDPGIHNTLISVKPDTAFYFDLEEVDGGRRTNFEMLVGTIGLKVQKLKGDEVVNVRTQTATMGVRGTTFEVSTAPDGSILITCTEGSVSCIDENGNEAFAETGRAVEQLPNERLRGIVVDQDMDEFRRVWRETREAVFRAGSLAIINHHVKLYQNLLPKFEEAYQALRANRDTFRQWLSVKSGMGLLGRAMVDKSRVSPAILKMRFVYPLFQRTVFRLGVFERYHRQGIGVGTLDGNLTTNRFFRQFQQDRRVLVKQMAEVRHYFLIFRLINRASSGGFSGGGEIFDRTFTLPRTE